MYIAKIAGHVITVGTELEIQGVDDFKFKVLEVRKGSFRVRWLSGDTAGNEGNIPHSLFSSVGQEVTVIEIPDKAEDNDPNVAFMIKRLNNDG